ncbi:hypothetical protein D3C85_975360 [compost metagenome]
MKDGAALVYTGRELRRVVTHGRGGYGLADGWVCLSHEPHSPGFGAQRPPERARRIDLERKEPRAITEQDRVAAFRVIFGILDGLAEPDRRNWRRFFRVLTGLEMGEVATIYVEVERQGPMHRAQMRMESEIYKAQEVFGLFEAFRDWLKVGAGHVSWQPGPGGELEAVPKSTAFENCGEVEFREYAERSREFLRSQYAKKQLWPHASDRARQEIIHQLVQ